MNQQYIYIGYDAIRAPFSVTDIGRFKKVYNTAERLILKSDSRSSATVMLNDLYWLSLKKIVMYKILLLLYISRKVFIIIPMQSSKVKD